MRCDDKPDGCTPCMQNNSECKTTDRITGKATVRGYVQSLEAQLEELRSRNRALESHLVSLGENVSSYAVPDGPATAPLAQWHDDQRANHMQSWDDSHQDLNTSYNSSNTRGNHIVDGTCSDAAKDHPQRLPEFRSGLTGNNYLGVSSGSSLLSSIRGTSMNVLGMEIDLADYLSADVDEPDPVGGAQPVYNKSYRAFVQTAFGTSPKLSKVELPPRSEGMNYAHVFFRVTNPYVPIMHKPSFIRTVRHEVSTLPNRR